MIAEALYTALPGQWIGQINQIRAIEILLCARLNTSFFYSRFGIGLGIMNVNGHIAASPSSFNLNKWLILKRFNVITFSMAGKGFV